MKEQIEVLLNYRATKYSVRALGSKVKKESRYIIIFADDKKYYLYINNRQAKLSLPKDKKIKRIYYFSFQDDIIYLFIIFDNYEYLVYYINEEEVLPLIVVDNKFKIKEGEFRDYYFKVNKQGEVFLIYEAKITDNINIFLDLKNLIGTIKVEKCKDLHIKSYRNDIAFTEKSKNEILFRLDTRYFFINVLFVCFDPVFEKKFELISIFNKKYL